MQRVSFTYKQPAANGSNQQQPAATSNQQPASKQAAASKRMHGIAASCRVHVVDDRHPVVCLSLPVCVCVRALCAGGGTENAGLALVVNEMLLSSPGGNYIELFPVWPPSEPASFSQLRAKGGFLVSAAWDNSTRAVGSCSVTATVLPGDVHLLNPWPESSKVAVTCGGSSVEVTSNERWLSWTPPKVGVPCSVRKG